MTSTAPIATLKTPSLLLGATLLFWGWLTGHLILGAILGVVLEASRWIRRRWEFTPDEFAQLWNITALLFLGAASYIFASNDGFGTVARMFGPLGERVSGLDKASETVLIFMRWMPVLFFPFVAAQAYSSADSIEYKTFSWFLRRRAQKAASTGLPPANRPAKKGVNTAAPYFAICMAAASATHGEPAFFYAGMSILLPWGFWGVRSPRYPAYAWAAAMAATALLGMAAALGMQNAQRAIELLQARWMSNIGKGRFDARESRTSIGQIGRMKESGQILLRITTPPGAAPPSLLREAAYEIYRWPSWQATGAKSAFESMPAGTNDNAWVFLDAASSNSVTISSYLDGGQGLLPLPHGVTRIDNLPAAEMKTNHLGTVKVESGPGLVVYDASYSAFFCKDSPPNTNSDLNIPESEVPALKQIVDGLDLSARPESGRVDAIERYFARGFTYSLYQDSGALPKTNDTLRTPLAVFLLKRKTGHCEFYATAAVLLLRQAGIPARYAVGYSVQEKTGANRYVVRSRHAHAWCLYYDRTQSCWRELDTTPGGWAASEASQKSIFEPVRDALSWAWYQFSLFRWGQGQLRQRLFQFVAILVTILIVRFVWTKRWKRKTSGAHHTGESADRMGLDSEYYQVEKQLHTLGLSRYEGETIGCWLDRIRSNLPFDYEKMKALLSLHYRLRFDPQGLPEGDRADLRRRAAALLKKI